MLKRPKPTPPLPVSSAGGGGDDSIGRGGSKSTRTSGGGHAAAGGSLRALLASVGCFRGGDYRRGVGLFADKKRALALVVLLLLLGWVFGLFVNFGARFSHWTRPLWGTPDPQWRYVFPNLEGAAPSAVSTTGESREQRCARYGLQPRKEDIKLVDAFAFGTELDMLEIRLHELKGIVDYHVLVESSVTFTGQPKRAAFQDNKDGQRFAEFVPRIQHVLLNEQHFARENRTTMMQRENFSRYAMALYGTSALRGEGKISTEGPGYLLMVSDVDEIPRAAVLRVIKECEGWPQDPIHLDMTRFLYSFEWAADPTAAAAVWQRNKTHGKDPLSHRRRSDTLFADAGWHCTFCFEFLEDFSRKMDAYAHADRGTRAHRDPERIQDVVCSGRNLYDGYEDQAFTYADVVRLTQPARHIQTTVGLPSYLLQNMDRFRYLLPGHCRRERKKSDLS